MKNINDYKIDKTKPANFNIRSDVKLRDILDIVIYKIQNKHHVAKELLHDNEIDIMYAYDQVLEFIDVAQLDENATTNDADVMFIDEEYCEMMQIDLSDYEFSFQLIMSLVNYDISESELFAKNSNDDSNFNV
tara:strand:+ start:405 stop:803 length:399 start_codon:yes stop_codon:yes gene_type:complete